MSAPHALSASPATPAPRHVPFEEYLANEQKAEHKSEWDDGVVRAMAGVRPRHAFIEGDLAGTMRGRLGGGPCLFLTSSVQIWLPTLKLYTYPDGAIACPPRFAPELPTAALTNPRVIFEILSPSTEGYDRRGKFRRYKTLESFEDYVLVSTDEPSVEVFSRADGWTPKVYEGLEAVALIPSVGIELPLAEIYAVALTYPE